MNITAERDDITGDIIARVERWPSHHAEREYIWQQTLRLDDRTEAEARLCEIASDALTAADDAQVEIARLSALLDIALAQGFELPTPVPIRTARNHIAADDAIDGRTIEQEV